MKDTTAHRTATDWQAPKLTSLGGADDSLKVYPSPNERTTTDANFGPGSGPPS